MNKRKSGVSLWLALLLATTLLLDNVNGEPLGRLNRVLRNQEPRRRQAIEQNPLEAQVEYDEPDELKEIDIVEAKDENSFAPEVILVEPQEPRRRPVGRTSNRREKLRPMYFDGRPARRRYGGSLANRQRQQVSSNVDRAILPTINPDPNAPPEELPINIPTANADRNPRGADPARLPTINPDSNATAEFPPKLLPTINPDGGTDPHTSPRPWPTRDTTPGRGDPAKLPTINPNPNVTPEIPPKLLPTIDSDGGNPTADTTPGRADPERLPTINPDPNVTPEIPPELLPTIVQGSKTPTGRPSPSTASSTPPRPPTPRPTPPTPNPSPNPTPPTAGPSTATPTRAPRPRPGPAPAALGAASIALLGVLGLAILAALACLMFALFKTKKESPRTVHSGYRPAPVTPRASQALDRSAPVLADATLSNQVTPVSTGPLVEANSLQSQPSDVKPDAVELLVDASANEASSPLTDGTEDVGQNLDTDRAEALRDSSGSPTTEEL